MARCRECIHYEVCAKEGRMVQVDEHTWDDYNKIDNVERFCDNYISTADVAPRAEWISVEEWIRAENPPEEYRDECGELIPFLVCCKGTVYPFRAMYDGTNWGDGIGVLKVINWMPLPEPPKGN